MVNGQRLYDLDIEPTSREQKKANIYKGRIRRVEPSLEAAFVEFGAERQGFLPLKEIAREYFVQQTQGRPNVAEVVREGQEIIVQVDKEERGSKGAALTSMISLAGRYLVLMPNNPRAGGISRRIEGEDRAQIREALKQVTVPQHMGVIVRTAGIGRRSEELQADLDNLLRTWTNIKAESESLQAPCLLLQEGNVVIRAIRDYLRKDIGEVLIDDQSTYDTAIGYIRTIIPEFTSRVKLYNDPTPLFSRFQIEGQIETAYQREVTLPSGGSIVIDPTEALVSIDINSAKATKGADIEETALQTNLEAADEIARQLRLRDIGGLIVIDFIDMTSAKNQRDVEAKIHEALELDRARIQHGKISKFGLFEMSRQRLRPSLGETSGHSCPRCSGHGIIRDSRSLSLSILRLVEEEASKGQTQQVRAIVPLEIAAFLTNEKRETLAEIEKANGVQILILPNPNLETPHYEVQRLRTNEDQPAPVSYEAKFEAEMNYEWSKPETAEAAKAAVDPIATSSQSAAQKNSLLKRVSSALANLFSSDEAASSDKKPAQKADTKPSQQPRREQQDKRSSNRSSSGNRPNRGSNSNTRNQERKEGSENRRSQENRRSDSPSRNQRGQERSTSRQETGSRRSNNPTGQNAEVNPQTAAPRRPGRELPGDPNTPPRKEEHKGFQKPQQSAAHQQPTPTATSHNADKPSQSHSPVATQGPGIESSQAVTKEQGTPPEASPVAEPVNQTGTNDSPQPKQDATSENPRGNNRRRRGPGGRRDRRDNRDPLNRQQTSTTQPNEEGGYVERQAAESSSPVAGDNNPTSNSTSTVDATNTPQQASTQAVETAPQSAPNSRSAVQGPGINEPTAIQDAAPAPSACETHESSRSTGTEETTDNAAATAERPRRTERRRRPIPNDPRRKQAGSESTQQSNVVAAPSSTQPNEPRVSHSEDAVAQPRNLSTETSSTTKDAFDSDQKAEASPRQAQQKERLESISENSDKVPENPKHEMTANLEPSNTVQSVASEPTISVSSEAITSNNPDSPRC